jgi:hypothetical protein
LIFVSLCNYLIAYQITRESVKEAILNNVYVKYWVYLLIFFSCTAVVSFLGLLFSKPEDYVDEGRQVFENQGRVGNGAIEEYVTVRIKRDELSKLNS